jgi:hypothetical protein
MKKCYFKVEQEIVIGHIVSSRGLEVVKAKIDVISSLSYPSCAREVCSFLVHWLVLKSAFSLRLYIIVLH